MTSPAVLILCTGNAARSVMAGTALRGVVPGLTVETAGTFAIDGMPMSIRTQRALEVVGVEVPVHRSRQAVVADLEHAGLIIGLAPEHVAWVRRTYPRAAARTGTLHRLARDLAPGPAPLVERLAALRLSEIELEPWEEVADPAGGDELVFTACARTVLELIAKLAPALRSAVDDPRNESIAAGR